MYRRTLLLLLSILFQSSKKNIILKGSKYTKRIYFTQREFLSDIIFYCLDFVLINIKLALNNKCFPIYSYDYFSIAKVKIGENPKDRVKQLIKKISMS